MKSFLKIITSDYLQRTRSYAFLVTLCATLAIAYTFVPEPNATYSTIRIDGYVGLYNSAWFGYVTAIMTSIFLSLIGFYLINSGIKTDIDTRVGQIIAATKINNFSYLFSKVLSNFLVLLTIVLIVLTMSIILFLLYNDGRVLEMTQFLKPYTLITLPAIFLVAVLAVISEVFFGKYSVLQNLGFFFLFSALMLFTPKTEAQFSLDVFGGKIVTHELEEIVRGITKSDGKTDLTIGYVLGGVKNSKKFEFNGMDFPASFVISRLALVLLGILVIGLISPFFHRFNVKERIKMTPLRTEAKKHTSKEINLSNLSIPKTNYSILPIVKTEFLLLFRKGKKWLWLLNFIGMLSLAMLPLKLSHQMVLPILWFLQISRLSDLTTKEITNNAHYFAFSSYKTTSRLLLSRLLSAVLLMLLLVTPLAVRLALTVNFFATLSVILGAIFIVLLAAVLGTLSKGKKLFEVLFFMLTYANINGISYADYFGGFEHHKLYIRTLASVLVILGAIIFVTRRHQLKNY